MLEFFLFVEFFRNILMTSVQILAVQVLPKVNISKKQIGNRFSLLIHL